MNKKELLAAWKNLFLYLSKEMKEHLSSLQISICTSDTAICIIKQLAELNQICITLLLKNNYEMESFNMKTPLNETIQISFSSLDALLMSHCYLLDKHSEVLNSPSEEIKNEMPDAITLESSQNKDIACSLQPGYLNGNLENDNDHSVTAINSSIKSLKRKPVDIRRSTRRKTSKSTTCLKTTINDKKANEITNAAVDYKIKENSSSNTDEVTFDAFESSANRAKSPDVRPNNSSESFTDNEANSDTTDPMDSQTDTVVMNENSFQLPNGSRETSVPKRTRKNIADYSGDSLFKEFRCIYCYELFSGFQQMMQHFLDGHGVLNESGEWEVSCLMCSLKWPGKKIKRNKLLAILHHLHCKHDYKVPEFINPYRCTQPNCSYICFRKDVYQHHNYSHDKAYYSATCDLCGITVNKARLTEHQKTCPENKERTRRFACHLCDRSYFQKTALRMHISVQHDKVKNFLCTICTQTMATRTSFFTHMYDIHGINIFNKPVLSCDICPDFSCLRKYQLVNHKLRIHSDAKGFQCDICMKCYKFSAELKSHKISHGEKSFSCQQCNFKTVREKDLKVHIVAQHTDQRYSCEICGYTSGYKENVLKHKRLSHKIVFNRDYKGRRRLKLDEDCVPAYEDL